MSIRRALFAVRLVSVVLFTLGAPHAATGDPLSRSQLSYRELAEVTDDDSWVIVDARTPDEFNGWALDGIQGGGHIPNARDFSATWLDVAIDNRTKRLADVLQSKGITSQKKIAVYSIRPPDRRRVVSLLQELGYQSVYEFDLQQWIRGGGALQQYPAYHRLVPPVIVKRLLDGELPDTFEKARGVKFVEVSWGDESASYAKGHVPGSFHVNSDHFEPPPTWYLGNSAVLTKFAADYGFQAADTVVISSADVTASYRLAVVLQYMGVRDVRVLNGGFAAWKNAGYAVETKSHHATKSAPFGVSIPQDQQLIVDEQRVKVGLREPGHFVLVDTRTWAEFLGDTSGYKYHRHKGRIPGSVYGQASYRGPNSLHPYRNLDDTMRNADEILALWRAAGIGIDKHLCFMCGGGWRAAEVLTFARVAGKEQTSLYSDGWIGWSNNRANPVDTGPPARDDS